MKRERFYNEHQDIPRPDDLTTEGLQRSNPECSPNCAPPPLTDTQQQPTRGEHHEYDYKTTAQLVELIVVLGQEEDPFQELATTGEAWCDELLERPFDKTSTNSIVYWACETSIKYRTGE